MEIRQLRYFVQAAEFGSISRAALSLQVAQSAVSRQISNLEEDLGAVLLIRHGRGVTLSEFGQQFLVRARAILDEVDQARLAARAAAPVPAGRVTIAVPPIVAPILVVHLMREVRARVPEVQVRVLEGLSSTIAEWVVQGSIDLGVYYTNRERRDDHTDILFREPLGLIGPASDRTLAAETIDFVKLSDVDLILPHRDHRLRLSMEEVATREGVHLKIVAELETVSAIMEMVGMGEGLTILPMSAVRLAKPGHPLKAARLASPNVDHILISRTAASSEQNLATRAVAQIIRQQVTRLVKFKSWG